MKNEKKSRKAEKFTIETAIQNLDAVCNTLTSKIAKLEEQYKEILMTTTKNYQEMEARLAKIEKDVRKDRIKTTLSLEDNKQPFGQTNQQFDYIAQTPQATADKQQFDSPDTREGVEIVTRDSVTPIQSVSHAESQTDNLAATAKSSAIIMPSPETFPYFSGKEYSDSPKQFLIRVEEFGKIVYGWDKPTLLLNISQFLQGPASEWYYQLISSNRLPKTWADFITLFLSQFDPPLRHARFEHEWYECKQRDDECFNEFLMRLMAIWNEQKPRRTEIDFINHLRRNMQRELFDAIGSSPDASLQEFITKVQSAEAILYLRNEDERLNRNTNCIPFDNMTVNTQEYQNNDNYTRPYNSKLCSNLNSSLNSGYDSNKRNNCKSSQRVKDDKCGNDRIGKNSCQNNFSDEIHSLQSQTSRHYSKNEY